MGRIVIPRPRTSGGRGYTPLYRPAIKARGNKFDPHRDLGLLVKALDTAVAIGGKISGAVSRSQDGPDAERARALVADDKAAAARAQAASAEMGGVGDAGADAWGTGPKAFLQEWSGSIGAPVYPEDAEITSTPDRGGSIVPGSMPVTAAPEDARQATDAKRYEDGFRTGRNVLEAIEKRRPSEVVHMGGEADATSGSIVDTPWQRFRVGDLDVLGEPVPALPPPRSLTNALGAVEQAKRLELDPQDIPLRYQSNRGEIDRLLDYAWGQAEIANASAGDDQSLLDAVKVMATIDQARGRSTEGYAGAIAEIEARMASDRRAPVAPPAGIAGLPGTPAATPRNVVPPQPPAATPAGPHGQRAGYAGQHCPSRRGCLCYSRGGDQGQRPMADCR